MELISEAKLRIIADQQKKNIIMLEKDYFLTLFLSLMQKVPGIYFKGGTAINKIFLNHVRLSEDLDFTITIEVEEARTLFERILQVNKNIFFGLSHDKAVFDFTRFIIHYKSFFDDTQRLILDVNKRAQLTLKPEIQQIPNFYGMEVAVSTLNRKEIVAEKVVALMNRNRPRDYFDVYQLIHHKVPIDLGLVEKKAKKAKQHFSVIKIFNNATNIYKCWNEDLEQFTADVVSFEEVMTTLKEYFKYTKEKETLKNKKKEIA